MSECFKYVFIIGQKLLYMFKKKKCDLVTTHDLYHLIAIVTNVLCSRSFSASFRNKIPKLNYSRPYLLRTHQTHCNISLNKHAKTFYKLLLVNYQCFLLAKSHKEHQRGPLGI